MPIDLEFNNISKKYNYRKVLNKVSGKLQPNQSVYLQGNNGVGKSTLLKILAGILRPDFGDFTYSNRPYLISDSHWLYSGLTLAENIDFQWKTKGLSQKSRSSQINLAFKLFKISKATFLRPSQCSKGILQRTSLVRAYLHKPKILLFDEPFSGLDEKGQNFLEKFLIQRKIENWKFSSLLLVDHNKERGSRLTDQIWQIKLGKLEKECDF